MDQDISFGSIVREHRQALGLTQAELARRVACATVTVRKIEYDSLRPSIQIAERLATSLNIPLEERAAFVHLARTASLKTPTPQPRSTPPPAPEEIGLEDLSGRAIRGYELGDRMGEGGFGVVYRAIQPLVEREVAVKIILPRYADHPEFIRRFEAEAQLVARLEHPHIVPLYDYWREPGAAFLVMRLMRGGSVHSLIKEGPLSLDFILRLLNQVGGALFSAHRMGIIHRDLKPANILLDEDQNTYLADFGVAKNLGNPEQTSDTLLSGIIGSPAYVSPEQIRAEPIRPQADIYALGVLLFQLLTGRQPFKGPTPIDYAQQHLNQPTPPLLEFNPNLPPSLEPVLTRATAKSPNDRYPDIPGLVSDFQSAVTSAGVEVPASAALEWLPADQVDIEAIENPYKGLRAFEEADTDDFFGRETLVQDLLGRMAEENDLSRFLAVVGPSGSGKSSAVKAGLIPSLRRGGLPGSEHWFIVEFTPGAHPFEELETALLRVAVNPPESLLGQLRHDERGLLRAVNRILPPDKLVDLVLVIDQFEELFTLLEDETIRSAFLESLLTALLDPRSRLRVVITLRADFTDRPLEYVDFGELLRQRTEFVLPLTPDELELAIVQPARQAGLALEPGLSERIIRDLGDQPGALPLLQYALTELFERRVGRRLILQAYQESGGVLGALGKRAEEIYTSLDSKGQETARQVFLRLVTLGEGVEDTRRRVLQSELVALSNRKHPETPDVAPGRRISNEDVGQILASFGRARLLAFDHDPVTRGPTVEVAHEALLREWPRLREWLDQSRADIRTQRVLSNAAADWMEADRDPSFLLRGSRLDQFAAWVETSDLALTRVEVEFIEACLSERKAREAVEAERLANEAALERRSRNFLRGLVGVMSVAAVVAVVLSIYAFNQQGIAQDNADTAQAEAVARATQQAVAEQQARLATSRELAGSAINILDRDPELGILLALQAVNTTKDQDGMITSEAESALHQAVQASHVISTISSHEGEFVWTVAYSPGGERLATGGGDGTVRIWDLDTGQELLILSGFTNEVWDVEFTPDGKRIAASSRDGTVRIWDAQSGEELMLLDEPNQVNQHSLDISPDGKILATLPHDPDNQLKIWDINSGVLLQTYDIPTSKASNFHEVEFFSPDGKHLAIPGGDGILTILDFATDQEILTLADSNNFIASIHFSPDGDRIYAVDGDRYLRGWDATSGEQLFRISEISTNWFAISPGGQQLAAFSGNRELTIFDALTGTQLSQITCHRAPNDIAYSPDGTQVAVTGDAGQVKICDTLPAHEALVDHHQPGLYGMEYSQDGRQLASVGLDGTIKIWDANSGAELHSISSETPSLPLIGLAFSPHSGILATGGVGKITLWDSNSGEELLTLFGHKDQQILWISFSPDGKRMATISFDGVGIVWDIASGKEVFTIHDESDWVYKFVFNQDGKFLASTGSFGMTDGYVRFWDASSGEKAGIIPVGQGTGSIDFSPDGQRLVTGSVVAGAVWDAISKEKVFDLNEENPFIAVRYSPDGSKIATGSLDGAVKLWDADTGQELVTLGQFSLNVFGVDFSPDGKILAATSWDGIMRTYIIDIEDLITVAKTRLTRSFSETECQKYLHTETCPSEP